ncbi:MAG: pyridoxal phosphate-dependent aminotransferase [Nakamurella sp.]
MRLADRAASHGGLNTIARVRAELTASGAAITNLSDSNPTRHGLLHPGVLAAVEKHVYDAVRYEPHPRGLVAARESLAERYGGDPGDYWLTSSTSQAYVWLMMLLADPGQSVAVPAPGYPLIPPLARLAGVRTVDYRLHYVHPHGWVFDAGTLAIAASDPGLAAVAVVNPGNPTGAYLDAGADDLIDRCAQADVALISDEVFGPFRLDGAPTTLAGEFRVPTFTLGGLSKLLCAPQLKLAWIRLSGPAGDLAGIRDGLDSIADAFLPVNEPVAAALPDLLTLAGESVASTRARLSANLATARATFADGPYRVRRCEGGWTVVIDVPRYLPSEDLAVHLLRTAHLAVHPGWFYDLMDEGAFALSLLPAPEHFTDGIRRLRAAIDDLADR